MFRAAVLLSLASVLLAALALISCLSVEDKSTIRGLPRFAWVLVILLLPLAGPAAWFLGGRPVRAGRPFGWSVPGWSEPPRPKAPDDDPEFLRSLGRSTSRPSRDREEELLRRWEEELQEEEENPRQREDEQRRRESGEG